MSEKLVGLEALRIEAEIENLRAETEWFRSRTKALKELENVAEVLIPIIVAKVGEVKP